MIHTNRSMNHKLNKKLRRICEFNDKTYLFINFNFILYNFITTKSKKKSVIINIIFKNHIKMQTNLLMFESVVSLSSHYLLLTPVMQIF